MKDYFFLQYKMINRQLREVGVHPVIGCIICLTAFILIFEYGFTKTEFTKYLILLVSFSFLLKFTEKNRTEFLLLTYGFKIKNTIRRIENLIIIIPFCVILLYHNAVFETLILIVASIIIATTSFKHNLSIILPTPFYKHPFEFTVGFRKTFYMYPIAYFLTTIAIYVDNLNLGVFSLLLVFLVSLSYYTKPENEYYVWVHAKLSKEFLFEKIIVATKNISILSLPIIIGLASFYWSETSLLLIFYTIGLAFLWAVILAKYSTYPFPMGIPEGILFAVSVYFPPFLLVLIPYFCNKAIKNLNTIL